MDRDDSALSLVTTTTTADSGVDLSQLTERGRKDFAAKKWAVLNIQSGLSHGQKLRPLCLQYASALRTEFALDLGDEQLRKLFYKWDKEGDEKLISGLLKGKKQARLIPAKVIQMYWSIYLDMKDKASKDGAWRHLMDRLCKGETLSGGITWQRLWLELHPTAELPLACPWNHHNAPPGWTKSTFTSLPEPDELVQALMLRGMAGAKALLAQTAGIRIDWSTLRLGECYMIDDHDPDLYCIVNHQIVRLRLIVLIEVRSRRVLAYVVRPRTTDDDGTMRSITRRDVQHLLAGWLWKFGLPRDFKSTLHMENAAATVNDFYSDILGRVTGGRLSTHKTALYDHVVRQYREHGGTPTGKPQIESKFRLFETCLSHSRGWTGRNYLSKPQELEDRKLETRKLLKRMEALPAQVQEELTSKVQHDEMRLPFLSLWEAHEQIGHAFAAMDTRMWHEMEGFLRVREFRTAPDSVLYYPLNPELLPLQNRDARETIQTFLSTPIDWQNKFLAWGRERAESSAECWQRLAAQQPWVKIGENSMYELLMDHKASEWNGTGSVRIEVAGRAVEFRPLKDALPLQIQAKSKVIVRYNEDAPELAIIQDAAGRVLGSLLRSDRTHYHDLEGKRGQAEFKAVTLAHALQEVKVYDSLNPESIRELKDRETVAAFMSPFEGEHGAVTPEATITDAQSDALVQAVAAAQQQQPKPVSARDLRALRKAAKV
jgi:hypothetical protein